MKLVYQYLTAAVKQAQYPTTNLPEFAVIGRSNVGKSSLINTLAGGKKIVRTSKTPGKTRLIHFFSVSDLFMFVDLPGYGYAKVPVAERNKWEKMITEYLTTREQLKLVILLIDCRHALTKLDIQMITWLQSYQIPFDIVATKTDKLKRNKLNQALAKLKKQLKIKEKNVTVLPFSSLTASGKPELLRHFIKRAEEKEGK